MTISRRIGFAAPPEKRPTGWKWDEMIWTKEQERHQSVIPTLMDPDISLIPEDLWRSGIGDGEDLRLINVVEDPHAGTPWYPVIKPGYYYLAWEQFYLFSPNSIIAFGGEETHSVWTNLTKVDLFWPPKPGEPIVVSFMHRREDGDVRDIDNFRHRVRFTGGTVIETDQYGDLVSKTEAVDLDSEGNVVDYNIANLPVDPEPRPLEFVVIQRPEAFTKEWMPSNHVVGQGTGLLEVVTLAATPVYGPPVAFSNMNLFTDYVHDDTPVNPGEYSIGYAGSVNIPEGEVWVMTEVDRDQIPGYVTYWTDFPATLLFNDYYVSRIGIEGWPPSAGTPPYELVTQGDYIGKSRMLPNQSFYLSYFPVLLPEEVRVFIYDPRNLQVEEWTRVDDLTTAGPDDKVFSISPDGGFVLFGDGVRGKIPHRYAYVSAHYQYIPLVEYMPDESILAIIPETINLQPLNNSVHRGFIFLGHKEPLVDQLVLVTNRPRVPDRPDTYGPIDAGNDFALLTCTAFTNEGDTVPEQELTWTLVPPLGYINGTNPYYTPVRTVTDQSGRSRVTYTPVRTAGDMGVIVDLFEGDGAPTGNITSTYQPNDTLILDEDVEGSVDDMWIFMVTNDDPMLPFDSARREGGRYVVLYRWDEDFYSPTSGEWVPVRPSQIIGTRRLLFDYSIPSPTDTPSLVQYAVLMDRIVTVNATTMNPVTGVQIISNDLKLFIRIPASQRGVFTLSGDTPDGSALDSAAYLSIARDGAMRFVFTAYSTTSTTTSSSTTTSTTASTTSSSTSTTATASTSSSSSSSTTSTAPVALALCPGTVFTDPFLVVTPDWTEIDSSGIAAPGPIGYEHLIHPVTDYAQLGGNFDIGGDFDICVEVDIVELPLGITSNSTFQFELFEGVKGGAFADIKIRGSGPPAGSAEYALGGTGSWGGPTSFGVLSAPSTHFLRFTRVGTTLTAYVWNSSSLQWEWDGNPAGIVHSDVWDVDPSPVVRWNDNNPGGNDYIGGTCRVFGINVGTKTP